MADMFELLGVISWPKAEIMARTIADQLRSKSQESWLSEGCVSQSIGDYLELSNKRLTKPSFGRVQRCLSQRLSSMLLRRIAKSHNIELVGIRCAMPNSFLVHNFMNPSVLIGSHADHLRHPEKDYQFWYTRPHKEWVDEVYDSDELLPDMIDSFETAFQDWLSKGYVTRVEFEASDPRSNIYVVHRAT